MKTSRREVHLEARMLLQPRSHLWMFVRGVVVRDQMQLEVGRRVAINLLQEAQLFDLRVARDQRARQLDKSGSDCGMPRMVMRHRAHAFGRQRKPELRSSAWHWLFSSQHNTRAFVGGSR
jgi:hypothetical protein